MKRIIRAMSILSSLCLLFGGCEGSSQIDPPAETSSGENASSGGTTSEHTVSYVYDGEESFSNRTLSNDGARMGDEDGPAYCVYSVQGVQAASMEVELSQAEIQIYREDGRHVNAYIFLGADVYHAEEGYWVNCADAGLVYSGEDGWHVFYNLYSSSDPNASTWYESDLRLNSDHDYRLTLDSSQIDGKAVLSVYDLTTDRRVERVILELQYAKKDGSNTAFLTDFALDYPEDTMQDANGNPSDDWLAITLGNTDRGMYLRNVRVRNCTVMRDGVEYAWTNEQTANRGIWPDETMREIDYACTEVRNARENISYIVNLDMNRK